MRYPTQTTQHSNAVSLHEILNEQSNTHNKVNIKSPARNTTLKSHITSSPHFNKNTIKQPIILLVEDDPLIQKVHSMMLAKLGYAVELAANGKQAVAMSDKKYDLILMDIGLPGMDGLQTSIAIREKHYLHFSTPIIALTAYGQSITEECLSVGINEVTTKPIKLDALGKIIKKWLTQE